MEAGVRELSVVGVRVELPSNQPIVLLREVDGDRYLPIWIGAVEATAIGNCLMQAIAAGDIADVAQAREVVRRSFEVVTYLPTQNARWAEAAERLTARRCVAHLAPGQ